MNKTITLYKIDPVLLKQQRKVLGRLITYADHPSGPLQPNIVDALIGIENLLDEMLVQMEHNHATT